MGTSRPSIVRFATKLGFQGYADLQKHVRQGMSRDLSRPSQRIRNQGDPGASTQGALAEAIDRVFEALQGEQLAQLAISVSPSHSELTGAARMAEEVPRQIANANTLFNVINTLLLTRLQLALDTGQLGSLRNI